MLACAGHSVEVVAPIPPCLRIWLAIDMSCHGALNPGSNIMRLGRVSKLLSALAEAKEKRFFSSRMRQYFREAVPT